MDAPAKCKFQNMHQYNGFYGCPNCIEPGKTFKTSKRGHTHIFPFNLNTKDGHSSARTHEQTLSFGREAQWQTIVNRKPAVVCGVKGISWSLFYPKYDVVRGTSIDYMHSVLLGVVHMLMSLWFDKVYKKESWCIGSHINLIDSRIKALKLPNCISRIPRSIEEELKH